MNCKSCKNFGGQGRIGLRKEQGEERYCALTHFSDMDKETKPMPTWKVTYGNAGASKGSIYVHEDFGCINHNDKFEQ